MTKITKESIEEYLLWKKVDYIPFTEVYHSLNKRYELTRTKYSNLSPEGEYGWSLQIDDSKKRCLAKCDVEYIEQIFFFN